MIKYHYLASESACAQITNGACECDVGWRGEVCDTPGCPGEGQDCSGHGLCNAATHECTCYPGWAGEGCGIPDCPGEGTSG